MVEILSTSAILAVGAVVSAILGMIKWGPSQPPATGRSHCDLTVVDNRQFEKYFAVNNTFASAQADEARCDTFYSSHLPLGSLRQNSYIIYGPKGSGKSMVLKCHALASDQRWVVELDSQAIRQGTSQFANNPVNHKLVPKAISSDWTDKDFAHLLLSRMVLRLVEDSNREHRRVTTELEGLPHYEKVRLVDIACLYWPHPIVKDLEAFLRLFVPEGWVPDLGFHKQAITFHEWVEIWKEVKIRPYTPEAVDLAFNAHGKLDSKACTASATDPYSSIAALSKIIKVLFDEEPTLVMDDLDELTDLFRDRSVAGTHVTRSALKKFISSATAPRLADIVMNGEIRWAYALPSEGMNYSDLFAADRARVSKIAMVELQWPLEALCDYADFHLQMMAKLQGPSKCANLTLRRFKEFVIFDETYETIKRLRHPRDLHALMRHLISELVTKAEQTEYCPSATDVHNAYRQACRNLQIDNCS